MNCSMPGLPVHHHLTEFTQTHVHRVHDAIQPNIQKTKIMASGPITSWDIDGETVETVSDFILGAPTSLQIVTAAMKFKDAYSLEEKL